jgi:mannose-6-phosphate isomerase-like protein (cupin superfamily)
MTKIFSKTEAGRLLHAIVDTREPIENRLDVCEGAQWLQVSVLNIAPGKKVSPHIHQPRSQPPPGGHGITQECWIVLRGEIKIRLFDLDHSPLHQQTLSPGHLLMTFYGGHALECGSSGALMIECKNGPYLGRDYTVFESA